MVGQIPFPADAYETSNTLSIWNDAWDDCTWMDAGERTRRRVQSLRVLQGRGAFMTSQEEIATELSSLDGTFSQQNTKNPPLPAGAQFGLQPTPSVSNNADAHS